MEYAFLRYAYADILEVRDDGFLLNIDRNVFDYNINEDKNLEFICGKDVISTKHKKISIQSLTTDIRSIIYLYVGDNEARRNPAARHVNVDAVKQESNVFMKYRDDNENVLPLANKISNKENEQKIHAKKYAQTQWRFHLQLASFHYVTFVSEYQSGICKWAVHTNCPF